MKADGRKTRLGCLTVLGLFAAVIAVGGWTMDDPPDEGAGIAVLGLFALAVLYVGSGVEWLTSRKREEARGFPVEPKPPGERE